MAVTSPTMRTGPGVAATYQGEALGAATLSPAPFTARILKRYSVPFVSPSTSWLVTLPVIACHEPQATPAQRTRYS